MVNPLQFPPCTGRHYTDRCDVFSFGIVLWEMIARRRPFLNEGKGPVNSMAIFWAMANGMYLFVWSVVLVLI